MFRRSTVLVCHGKEGAMITSGHELWVSDKASSTGYLGCPLEIGWKGLKVEPLLVGIHRAR